MKSGLGDIIEKTIANVVVAKKDSRPHNQVFIVFTDNTYLELYGEQFNCSSGIDRGDVYDAIRYVDTMHASIVDIYGKNVVKDSTANDPSPP